MIVKVKNIQGTAPRSPYGYTSWKEYWIAKSNRRWPYHCAVTNCHDSADVGAHVKLVNGASNKWYIVPLCYGHNNDHDAEFYVDSEYLVPVND